jgi:hypothetical protein
VTSELFKAAADSNISAQQFIAIVKDVLSGTDEWKKGFALEAFVLKATVLNAQQLLEVEHLLSDERQSEAEYLSRCARIGYMFANESQPNREHELATDIRWLVANRPYSTLLSSPFCLSCDGDEYVTVYKEWLNAVSRYSHDVRVLSNAAEFMFARSYEEAESLFLRCVSLEPHEESWQQRLDELREFHAK